MLGTYLFFHLQWIVQNNKIDRVSLNKMGHLRLACPIVFSFGSQSLTIISGC